MAGEYFTFVITWIPTLAPSVNLFGMGEGYLVQMNLSKVGYLTSTQSVRTQGALGLRSLFSTLEPTILADSLTRTEMCLIQYGY